MQFRILIINDEFCGRGDWGKVKLLQRVYKRHFILLLACSTILLLLFVLAQFLPEITLTITVHIRFVPVFAQYTSNICLIDLILHHNHYLAEVLQQQAQEY